MAHEFVPSDIPTLAGLSWPVYRQRCNCLRADTSRVCIRHDNPKVTNKNTQLLTGFKLYIDEMRIVTQVLFDVGFGFMPWEWLPQWVVAVDRETSPPSCTDLYEYPIHGFTGYAAPSIDLTQILMASPLLTVASVEKHDDGDVLVVNENVFDIGWYSYKVGCNDGRCLNNAEWTDNAGGVSSGDPQQTIPESMDVQQCKKGHHKLPGDFWNGVGIFLRDDLDHGHGYGLNPNVAANHGTGTQDTSGSCANHDCPDFNGAGDTSNADITTHGMVQNDVIVMATGILASPAMSGNCTPVLMYQGGRQYKIMKVYKESGLSKIKVAGLIQNNDLIQAGDSFNILRLRNFPNWEWVIDNRKRQIIGGVLMADVTTTPARGTQEVWIFNDTHVLRIGDVFKIGFEYVQVISVSGSLVTVKRGYLDSWLGTFDKQQQPMLSVITITNSVIQKHNAGQFAVVNMRACWFDVRNPGLPNGGVCGRTRESIKNNYLPAQLNDFTTYCTNTTCHRYFSRPVKYRASAYHETIHRQPTAESRHMVQYDYGAGVANITYILTEPPDGPSLMGCMGKWGLIDNIINPRDFGWHTIMVIDGISFGGDGETIDYHFPHNGIYVQKINGSYYNDSGTYVDRGGEYCVGGDIANYLNGSGAVKQALGLIYAGIGGQGYRSRHFTDLTDPKSSSTLGTFMGMQRLSLISWAMKPQAAFDGKLWRYK